MEKEEDQTIITLSQYFGSKVHSADQEAAFTDLILRVENLVGEAAAVGAFERRIDPDTGSEISGSRGGAGDGGFRLPTAMTGKSMSSHKEAKAVDIYDPMDELDGWLNEFETGEGENSKLKAHGLYREAPSSTAGWTHLTTRAPGSGRRTFTP